MNTLPDTWPFPTGAEDQREALDMVAAEVKQAVTAVKVCRNPNERGAIQPPLTLIPDAPY